LLTRVVADATADGLMSRAGRSSGADGTDKPESGVGVDEPLAEWEQELMVAGDPGSGAIAPSSAVERESVATQAETMVANNGVSHT
jgi:small subunit ribosomal protein S2